MKDTNKERTMAIVERTQDLKERLKKAEEDGNGPEQLRLMQEYLKTQRAQRDLIEASYLEKVDL